MAQIFHVGDVGTVLRYYCRDGGVAVDISSASEVGERVLRIGKPNGNVTEYAADFETDGTDGLLNYTVAAGVLDTDGEWFVEAEVELTAGQKTFTAERFHVRPKL